MNIVFDLGGVVFRWQPEEIIRHHFQDPKDQGVVRSQILEHADWVELDRGTITLDQAVSRGTSRTGLPRGQVEKLLKAVPEFLTPIEETIQLIRDIHGSSNSLFVLSKMHAASIAYLEERHRFWDLFDGIVISSRIQKVKPEIEIYEYLLTAHGLNAAETVFVDDLSENLAAASTIGIHTIRFIDADQCRQDLNNLVHIHSE